MATLKDQVAALQAELAELRAQAPVAQAPVYVRKLRPTTSCGHRFTGQNAVANREYHMAWHGCKVSKDS